MKLGLAGAVLLVIALPACRSGAPRGTPGAGLAGPDPLKPYVGDVRILKARADERRVVVDPRKPLTGTCDMAVRVRAARFEKGAALFSLETVGRPKAGAHETRCREVQGDIQLRFAGASAQSPDLAPRVDAVLQTPEAYLASRGIPFTLAAGVAPTDIADSDAASVPAEAILGRKVTTWPRVLLAVHPYVRGASAATRQESEVEFEAVVGTDGRLHAPRVTTPLGAAHRDLVLGALARWRYEPAKTAAGAVGARVRSRLALRIY